jgi:thioredoxin reductase
LGLDDKKEVVVEMLKQNHVRMITINVEKDFEKKLSTIHFHVHIAMHADTELLCAQIAALFDADQIRYVQFQTME